MKKKLNPDKRKIMAAEYYSLALQYEKQHEYMKAYDYYQKSLKLNKDEEVTKAYLRLLSIIGPL